MKIIGLFRCLFECRSIWVIYSLMFTCFEHTACVEHWRGMLCSRNKLFLCVWVKCELYHLYSTPFNRNSPNCSLFVQFKIFVFICPSVRSFINRTNETNVKELWEPLERMCVWVCVCIWKHTPDSLSFLTPQHCCSSVACPLEWMPTHAHTHTHTHGMAL